MIINQTAGGKSLEQMTSDADATADDILAPKTAYVNGVKVTGTGSGGSAAPEMCQITITLGYSSAYVFYTSQNSAVYEKVNVGSPKTISVQKNTCVVFTEIYNVTSVFQSTRYGQYAGVYVTGDGSITELMVSG